MSLDHGESSVRAGARHSAGDRVRRVSACATSGAAGAALFALLIAVLPVSPAQAEAERDVLQIAINYVFTGQVAPPKPPEITDRKNCVIVVYDNKFDRFVRYYLRRFNMEQSNTSTIYSGRTPTYVLDVPSLEDDNIVEFLSADRSTVVKGFATAHVPLPGDIDETRKALTLIFTDYCKPGKEKLPF